MILQHLLSLFGADRYRAFGEALTYDKTIIALYALFNLTTWVSLTLIAIALYVERNRAINLSRAAISLYAAVVFLCSCTFLVATLTIVWGIYLLDISVRAATAAAAAMTAFFTVRAARAVSRPKR